MSIRLSRAGWNNVIIFSVMGFILLINLTQPQKDDSEQSATNGQQSIIGEQSVILTMTIAQQLTIERAGQSWRTMPEDMSNQLVEQMMRSWHSAQGHTVDINFDRSTQQGIFISMVLAGEQAISMFTLYPLDDQLLVFNHQNGLYVSLARPMVKQLLPNALLRAINHTN